MVLPYLRRRLATDRHRREAAATGATGSEDGATRERGRSDEGARKGRIVPKYLIQAVYTADGAKGLLDKGGTARRKAVEAAAKSVGGSVDHFYFAFGETDAVTILDLPDHASAAALALTVSSSGGVETTTTVLLTPEELDAASKKSAEYRSPGG
jgi:uncharacterized protein with GYD domain